MRTSVRKFLSSLLTVLLVYCMFVSIMSQTAYAETTPPYRPFLDYQLVKDDWTITDNGDGTYNVKVSGSLNMPLRDGDMFVASLGYADVWENELIFNQVGDKDFTIEATLPDTDEANFSFIIQQRFRGDLGGNNWYHFVSVVDADGEYSTIGRWVLVEESVSFPVQKVWADGAEGKDAVVISLLENDTTTSYTVTLSEKNNWQGAFKHVPYYRWRYILKPVPKPEPKAVTWAPNLNSLKGKEIWLDPRGTYNVKERSGAPGYIAKYEFTANTGVGYFTVTNTPIPPAALEVSKTVSGAGADPNQIFTFTVTLDDKTVSGTYGDMKFKGGTATFTLKHGEHKTATNLPVVGYTVSETDNTGYTVTVNGAAAKKGKVTDTLVSGKKAALAFNNKKELPAKPTNVPKTGDSSNTVLWFVLMGLSATCLITMLFAKRKIS